MTLTINDTTMTSDQTAHTARQDPAGTAGKVLAARPDPGHPITATSWPTPPRT